MKIYQLYSKELTFEEQFFFDILNYVMIDYVAVVVSVYLANFFSNAST